MEEQLKAKQIEACKATITAMVEYWADSFKPTGKFMKDPNRKWIASSCMQKAIRRGQYDLAVAMADGITSIDPDYVWRRINVIALEDIGFGCFEKVKAILWVSGNGTWRKKMFGNDQMVMHACIKGLCVAPKDRTVTDLAVWVDNCPDLSVKLRQLVTACGAAFVKGSYDQDKVWMEQFWLAQDQNALLEDRMIAAWAVSGAGRFKGEFELPLTNGDYKWLVADMFSNGLISEDLAFISSYAASKLGDALPISMLFCERLHGKTSMGDVEFIKDEIHPLPMLGNYTSETFDWFTKEGKRALAYWTKNCKPLRDLMEHCEIPVKKWTVAASALLFRVEGAKVDERIRYDGSLDIFKMAEVAMCRQYGIPTNMVDVAMQIAYSNLDSMHWARCKVLDLTDGAVPPAQWFVGTHNVETGAWGMTTTEIPIANFTTVLDQYGLAGLDYGKAEQTILAAYAGGKLGSSELLTPKLSVLEQEDFKKTWGAMGKLQPFPKVQLIEDSTFASPPGGSAFPLSSLVIKMAKKHVLPFVIATGPHNPGGDKLPPDAIQIKKSGLIGQQEIEQMAYEVMKGDYGLASWSGQVAVHSKSKNTYRLLGPIVMKRVLAAITKVVGSL